MDDPNFNPFESKAKVVNESSSRTPPSMSPEKPLTVVEPEPEPRLPSEELPPLEFCEPPPNTKTSLIKKDSTPEFEAAEQQILDDTSFQVSNISDLKEHLFNTDLDHQEKDLTEPGFLLSANRMEISVSANDYSRLPSMPLELPASPLAQSPISILKGA